MLGSGLYTQGVKMWIGQVMMNHLPTIPPSADNDEVNKRNLKLLNDQWEKPKRSNEVMKILMTHTYPFKRAILKTFVLKSYCLGGFETHFC